MDLDELSKTNKKYTNKFINNTERVYSQLI